MNSIIFQINSISYVIVVYIFILIFDVYTGEQLCIPTGIYFHLLTCFVNLGS